MSFGGFYSVFLVILLGWPCLIWIILNLILPKGLGICSAWVLWHKKNPIFRDLPLEIWFPATDGWTRLDATEAFCNFLSLLYVKVSAHFCGFHMVSCSSTHIIIIIIVINYTYCCYMALTCYHCYFLFIKVYHFYCCHFSRIILVYDHISWCIILTLRLFHFSQPSFCCWSKALCLLWSAVFGTSTDGKALESAVGGGETMPSTVEFPLDGTSRNHWILMNFGYS